jgi:hypothetical protein
VHPSSSRCSTSSSLRCTNHTASKPSLRSPFPRQQFGPIGTATPALRCLSRYQARCDISRLRLQATAGTTLVISFHAAATHVHCGENVKSWSLTYEEMYPRISHVSHTIGASSAVSFVAAVLSQAWPEPDQRKGYSSAQNTQAAEKRTRPLGTHSAEHLHCE